jgi:hypothetical protein
MTGRVVRLLLTLGVLLVAGVAEAAEPLPAPRPVPAPVYSPYMPYYRRSAYEVWQYYGVDRTGHFRPRVVYSPYGAYYLYDGTPFPWTTNHPLEWLQILVD